MDSITGLFVD